MKYRFTLTLLCIFLVSALMVSCESQDDSSIFDNINLEIKSFTVAGNNAKIDHTMQKVVINLPENANFDTNLHYVLELNDSRASANLKGQGLINFGYIEQITVHALFGPAKSKTYDIQLYQQIDSFPPAKEVIEYVKIDNNLKQNIPNQFQINHKNKTIDIQIQKDNKWDYPPFEVDLEFNSRYDIIVKKFNLKSWNESFMVKIKQEDGSYEQYEAKLLNTLAYIEQIAFPTFTYTTNTQATIDDYFAINVAKSPVFPDYYVKELNSHDYIWRTLIQDKPYLQSVKPLRVLLSDGAKITPSLDTPVDLTKEVTYHITSESGHENKVVIRPFFENIILYNESTPVDYNALGNNLYYVGPETIEQLIFRALDDNYSYTLEATLATEGPTKIKSWSFILDPTKFPKGKYEVFLKVRSGQEYKTFKPFNVPTL